MRGRSKWVLSLITGLSTGLASAILIYKRCPHLHELPVFLAPITTMIVATMTFLDYMFDKEIANEKERDSIQFACVVGIMVSGALCWWLTFFQGWFFHLLLMIILFSFFLLWDLRMLRLVEHEEHRKQLAMGNRLVNRPTLVAVGLAMLFLSTVKLDSLQFTATKIGYESSYDAFAAGLISFHLIVSACGYLATTLSSVQHNSNWFLRFLHGLLYKIPAGPQ